MRARAGRRWRLYITFHAGRLALALPMEAIEEVLPAGELCLLPGTHPWVAGVLVRRGSVIGVIDPAALNGGSARRRGELLVLRGRPGLALLGDDTDAVMQGHALEAAAGPTPVPGAEALLRCAGGSFSVMDVGALRRHLGAEEKRDEVPGEEHGEQDPAGR